jgi:cytochrome c biogenesis protein CcmG/thiol:disulfide interchange protein DsbE
MIKYARVSAILTLALTVTAVSAACAQPRPASEAVAAPDFSIKDLQGKTLKLADYRGKVLVLNFWATWCPPCRKEIPDFVAAYRELKGEGLEILGLSVDQMTETALLEWTRQNGVNYPVALATYEIVEAYEPGDFIPATIIIDRKGIIRFRQSELMTKEALVRLFRQYQ